MPLDVIAYRGDSTDHPALQDHRRNTKAVANHAGRVVTRAAAPSRCSRTSGHGSAA
jgi:hypothetical protein